MYVRVYMCMYIWFASYLFNSLVTMNSKPRVTCKSKQEMHLCRGGYFGV